MDWGGMEKRARGYQKKWGGAARWDAGGKWQNEPRRGA